MTAFVRGKATPLDVLVGLATGVYAGLDAVAYGWQCERRFEPRMNAATRAQLYAGWQKAVQRVLTR